MTQRFYLEPAANAVPLAAGATVRLTDAEAHHFLHVMRGKVGEEIIVFDGLGHECSAIVRALTRREVEVQISTVVELPKQWNYPFHLGVSLPKGDRARWLVEKLTELGVPSLTPLMTERANARPDAKSLEKLGRYSIEACKQCGRNRLLEVGQPCTLEEFDRTVGECVKLVCHPSGTYLPAGEAIGKAIQEKRPLAVIIGPEGGLSNSEIDSLVALGWESISLGKRILRIETAALAIASISAPQMPD